MDSVQSVEGGMTGIKTQISALEHTLQDKVGASQLQQVSDTYAGLKNKVASLEQAMRVGTDRVSEMETAVANVGMQLTSVKQAVHEGRQGMFMLDMHQHRES